MRYKIRACYVSLYCMHSVGGSRLYTFCYELRYRSHHKIILQNAAQ